MKLILKTIRQIEQNQKKIRKTVEIKVVQIVMSKVQKGKSPILRVIYYCGKNKKTETGKILAKLSKRRLNQLNQLKRNTYQIPLNLLK